MYKTKISFVASVVSIIFILFILPFVYSFCCGDKCYSTGICDNNIWYPCGCNVSSSDPLPPGRVLGECAVCVNRTVETVSVCEWRANYSLSQNCVKSTSYGFRYGYCNISLVLGAAQNSTCYERDANRAYCEVNDCKQTYWVASGETISSIDTDVLYPDIFEYNLISPLDQACCGDDASEYPITANSMTRCCDTFSDTLNALGACQSGSATLCGNGVIELAGQDGKYGQGNDDEECDDGNINNSDFCYNNCTLSTLKGKIIDFNGPTGTSEDEWIKVNKNTNYPDTIYKSGWFNVAPNEINEKDDSQILNRGYLYSKLIGDYNAFNSDFILNLTHNGLMAATYDITYFTGGETNTPTGIFTVKVKDSEMQRDTFVVQPVQTGQLTITQRKNIVLKEYVNFSFKKQNPSELGVINGIVLTCVATGPEINGDGLDNNCDGIVDMGQSFIENRENKEKNLTIILGLEYYNESMTPARWINYTVVYNSSSFMVAGTGLIPFRPNNGFVSKPNTLNNLLIGTGSLYYNSYYHYLQYYWSGWTPSNSDPLGKYRVYLELKGINGTAVNNKQGSRFVSNIFNVTDT